MVFILADVFAKADYLGRAGFPGDIETGHLDACACATVVDHAPHPFHHGVMNVFRNRYHLRIRSGGIQRLKTVSRTIFARSRLAYSFEFFQKMRGVEVTVNADTGNRSQQRHRGYDVVNLTERSIHRVNVSPLRVARLHPLFKLARRSPADNFVGQINSGAAVEIKFINHRLNSLDAHFQSQSVEVTVARLGNGRLDIRRSMVAHAPSKLVSDCDAATANEVRVVNRDRALLQSCYRHWNLPGRARWVTALYRAVQQRRLRII